MSRYLLDLSKLTEEEKEAISLELHSLQQTCMPLSGNKNVGVVYGSDLSVKILQDKGYDVKPGGTSW